MRFRRYPQNRGPRTHCEEEGGEAHSFSMHMSDALRTGTISARKPLPPAEIFRFFPWEPFQMDSNPL